MRGWKEAALGLAVLVLLSGCVEGGFPGMGNTSAGPGTTGQSETTVSGQLVEVRISGLPAVLDDNESQSFSVELTAKEEVSDVDLLIYNLGSYVASSCSGSNRVGDMDAGESETLSCTLELVDQPPRSMRQDMSYEVNYRSGRASSDVSLTVLDSTEYARQSPEGGSDSVNIGDIGHMDLEPVNIEEGRPATLTINLEADGLIKNNLCDCHVEKLTVEVPRGFVVRGLEDWSQVSCENSQCFRLNDVETPLEEQASLSISGVTRSNEFYIKLEAEGIWRYEQGSASFRLLAPQS